MSSPGLGRNPFRPGVGTRPPYLAGRDRELTVFRSLLRGAPERPANVRLTGLRGVGKTVLLTEFETIAGQEGWAALHLELEPRHNYEADLAQALHRRLDRMRQQLTRTAAVRARLGDAVSAVAERVTLTYQDISLTFDPGAGENEADLARALFEGVTSAVNADRGGLVLLLDEAQVLRDDRAEGNHPLSLLLAAATAIQRVELPLALVVCGLPTLTTNLLRARTYTERMFRGVEISSLDTDAARAALVRPLSGMSVTIDDRLVDRVLRTVDGYPYFIQLWGAELWDAADVAGLRELTTTLLEGVEPEIYRRLDLDFYQPRVEALTPAEQDLLSLAALCPYPPLYVSDLQQVTSKRPGNVNVLLGRLVAAGVLYRVRKGEYAYTAPKFHEYLQRRPGHIVPNAEGQMSWTWSSGASYEADTEQS